MPKVSAFTLKNQPYNPIPTQLEVIIYDALLAGKFTKKAVLKCLRCNPDYLNLYLRNPSFIRIGQMRALAAILGMDDIEVLKICLERANNKERIKRWAFTVPMFFEGRNLLNVAKKNKKADYQYSLTAYRDAVIALGASV